MSEQLRIIRCKNCDAQIDPSNAQDGVVHCPYCHSVFTVAKTSDSSAATQLVIAESLLDGCEFDRAYDAFKKAASIDGSEPQAYFGMALATFKVQYLKDLERDRLQPICHEMTGKKFTDNADYKKALAVATAEQKGEYMRAAEEIDRIRNEFYRFKQSGAKYDCFICVKVTGEEKDADGNALKTHDSVDAHRIYDYLLKNGHNPFYSERDASNRTGADYEALILYALVQSSCMIVVCGNEDYLKTIWVKNEYTRFLRLINNDEKSHDSLTIAWRGTPIERLPGRDGRIQGVDLDEPDAYPKLREFVDAHAQFEIPTITRRTYGDITLNKKSAIKSGVQKRVLKSYAKSAVPVSEHTKLALVKDLLDEGAYEAAIARCDAIISANESCSKAYYCKFLAENKSRNAGEFVMRSDAAVAFDTLEAMIATASPEESKGYYTMLRDKVRGANDFRLYEEFIALPDSDKNDIDKLTEHFYNYIIARRDLTDADVKTMLNFFGVIIKTVTDTDIFVKMNKGVAEWLWHKLGRPSDAKPYMLAALDADETDGDCRYDCFELERGLTDENARDAFFLDKSNRDTIERELFDYGFNARAAQAMFNTCLRSTESSAESGAELCGYLLSVIPPEQERMFKTIIEKYVYALIKASKFGLAKSFNDKLLAVDRLAHEAYFMNVLISRKYDNPFLLINDRNALYDDPDYAAAMEAYAETFPDKDNAYMLIAKSLKSIDSSDAQEILRLCDGNVMKSGDLADFSSVVLSTVADAKAKQAEYERKYARDKKAYEESVYVFEMNVRKADEAIWNWLEQKLRAKGSSVEDCKAAYKREFDQNVEDVAESMSYTEEINPDEKFYTTYASSGATLMAGFINDMNNNYYVTPLNKRVVAHLYVYIKSRSLKLIDAFLKQCKPEFRASELYGLVESYFKALSVKKDQSKILNKSGIKMPTYCPPKGFDIFKEIFTRSSAGREKDRLEELKRQEEIRQAEQYEIQRNIAERQRMEREAAERRERKEREAEQRRQREEREAAEQREIERQEEEKRKKIATANKVKRVALTALFAVIATVFAAATVIVYFVMGINMPAVCVFGVFLTALFLIAAIVVAASKDRSHVCRRGFRAGVWFAFFAVVLCFAIMLIAQFAKTAVSFGRMNSEIGRVFCLIIGIFMIAYSLAALFLFLSCIIEDELFGDFWYGFRGAFFGFFIPLPCLNVTFAVLLVENEDATTIAQIVESAVGVVAALVFCLFLV